MSLHYFAECPRRENKICIFRHKTLGCVFTNSTCLPVIELCINCEYIEEVNYTPEPTTSTDNLPFITTNKQKFCKVYADPSQKWVSNTCPMATHIKREVEIEKQTFDPRKAAKQRRKK